MAERRYIKFCSASGLWGVVSLAVMALVMAAPAVRAGTCVEEVRRLAEQYNLSITPPQVSEDQGLGAEIPSDLGRTGGLIEPPPTQDPAVIEPPEAGGSAMPTLPDISPDPQTGDEVRSGTLSASDRAVLESILIAARSEAERGDEEVCFQRLQAAERFVARESQNSGDG